MKLSRCVPPVALALVAVVGVQSSAFGAGTSFRIAGMDRFDTSLRAYEYGKQAGAFGGQNVVLIVGTSGSALSHAAIAAPLAASQNAPVIVTLPDASQVAGRLASGGVQHVTVVGDASDGSMQTCNTVTPAGMTCNNIIGADAHETSAMVAGALTQGGARPVFLVDESRWSEAFTGAAAAATAGGVVLFTQGNSLTSEAAQFINSAQASRVEAIGGGPSSALQGASVKVPVSSTNGQTAAEVPGAVARQYFPGAGNAVVISGQIWPDALSGPALAGALRVPVLPATDPRLGKPGDATLEYLSTTKPPSPCWAAKWPSG